MFNAELAVYRYKLEGSEVVEYFCDAELEQQTDPGKWRQGEEVTTPGKLLSLTGERAEELGVARFAVDNFAEFKRLYELENDPALVEPSWVDDLIDYLAAPQIAASLLFFAGFALMMELSSPGLGVGGFVAAVCFVLFFWSQFLHGTADWLEILLFLTGVACVAIEIFVIPGFGVFGMGGGLLMIAALVLASQTFIFPRNDYQMNQFPRSLMMVLAAGGGVGAGLVVLRKFMDRAPVLRRIILAPPGGAQYEELARREALVDFSHLLGQVGMTISPLVPAGKARFGNEFVSVISDGDIISKGTPVKVTRVTGNRVEVVAEAGSASEPAGLDDL
jgi:membrane-bound ClpP family serine protease